MDGIPALDLQDLVITFFLKSTQSTGLHLDAQSENAPTQKPRNTPTRWKILAGQWLTTSHQTQNFLASVLCFIYFFDDKEAVIKMIIKSQKSDNETRVPKSQSPHLLGPIGYLTESTWTQKSKSNTLIPRTNSPTC